MEKRKSIRWKVMLSILEIFIPFHLAGMLMGQYQIKYMKEQMIEDRQRTLSMFGEQLWTQIDIMEMYLLQVTSDSDWNGLNNTRKNFYYEAARQNLWSELDKIKNVLFPDVIYVQLHESSDWFKTRNLRTLTYEDSFAVDEWLREDIRGGEWELIEIGGQSYLRRGIDNGVFMLGALVSTDRILEGWDERSGRIEIGNTGKIEEQKDFYTISEDFLGENLVLVNYMPISELNRDVPFWAYNVIWLSVFGLLAAVMLLFILRRILVRPLEAIENSILKIDGGNIEYRITDFSSTKEFYNIESNFNSMLNQIYDLRIEKYDLELEKQKMQLINLQQQINPHLLLNSLTTVFSLAQTKKIDKLQSFVMNLVKYLRYSLRNTGRYTTVEQEIAFIGNYEEIQKVRYPERFFIMYSIESQVENEKIPPLLIQNFVENSIKHGMVDGRIIEIDVIAKKVGEELVVSVCDDGSGISEEILAALRREEPVYDENGEHIGIWNCVKRLKMFYGTATEITIQSRPGEGTQVWMKLPCIKEEQDEPVDCR